MNVDDGSLDTAEKKLSAWTAKKKTLKFDDKEGLAECDANIKKWSDEIKQRKIALGISPEIEEGSINYIKNQIKELEEQ